MEIVAWISSLGGTAEFDRDGGITLDFARPKKRSIPKL
jgi:hypothetical protein